MIIGKTCDKEDHVIDEGYVTEKGYVWISPGIDIGEESNRK